MIVHLSKFYFPYQGGIETVVKDIAEGVALSTDCKVICNEEGIKRTQNDNINGVDIVRCRLLFKFLSTPFSFSYLVNTILNFRNNIIHLHAPNPFAFFCVFIAYSLGLRPAALLVHWHSDIINQKRVYKLVSPLIRFILNRADEIVFTSQSYLDCSEQVYEFKNKCIVIPIGTRSLIERVNKDLVKQIKDQYNGRKIIFCLGRHVYYKGISYVIKAMQEQSSDCVLLIGGRGPETGLYINLITQLNLQDRVFILGSIDESKVASYFSAASVFAFPSCERSEAYGLVQLESMSVGTPVICANIPGSGVAWVNQHDVSGMVFENKSVESLTNALKYILKNDSYRKNLAVGAQQRYNKFFTLKKMNDDFLELYEKYNSHE